MRLKSLEYKEFVGAEPEWRLEGLSLGPINLIVGKNATGKSRVINVISGLGRLLSGQMKEVAISGSFHVFFEDGSRRLEYDLEVETLHVVRESFSIDGQTVLQRGRGGSGKIRAQDIEGEARDMRFQTTDRELAVVARRDEIQHPFLQPLHDWGASVLHFEFGKGMGHGNLGLAVKVSMPQPENIERDQVVLLLGDGQKRFGDAFSRAVIADMQHVGYDLEELKVAPPLHLRLLTPLPGDLVGVATKERSLRCFTDQPSMAQGMFRALSLLIQLNYALMRRKPACVLIDDIGEGLDFERACDLVGLLREKALENDFQLVMSTNDRFVMNKVPLKEWAVLQREGQVVRVRNYVNSREAFEEFEFTGLSNFDFFATDYLTQEVEEAARP